MLRLLKPLDYYANKYGRSDYGLEKLYLMMEKQHNRGQEGAGIAAVHLDAAPGHEYMFRERAEGKDAISEVFGAVNKDFVAEAMMGHLRYSTTGKSGLKYVHPFLRRNNWRARNLCLCGNFNMTNISEVFSFLTDQGQHPRIYSDSYIMLELMGHRLDREVERVFSEAKEKGLEGRAITEYIDNHVDMGNVLRSCMPIFDGGYVICGLTGSGEMFTIRDPWGIRPAFYYRSDEIVAVASERAVLQTAFDLEAGDVEELKPGMALIVGRDGSFRLERIIGQKTVRPCSFERIYFSRGNDKDIYTERRMLGKLLLPSILDAVDGDVDDTVFSFIPNTAEAAYFGMVHGLFSMGYDVRFEKIVWKDIKMRTFITDDSQRASMAAHVYDITYGTIRPGKDNLVVIDDSIVRGTTLRESIIKILYRLRPHKIVIVSSAPQIRYPDFYGIDMANLEELIAFQACIALLKERGMQDLAEDVYRRCKEELEKPAEEQTLPVRDLYKPFSVKELNEKMEEMLRPAGGDIPVELVFQSIEGLHEACPNHPGDWYFTGNYPTPGGTRMCNLCYVQYFESKKSEILCLF